MFLSKDSGTNLCPYKAIHCIFIAHEEQMGPVQREGLCYDRGLYSSLDCGGLTCCEPEGFRAICWESTLNHVSARGAGVKCMSWSKSLMNLSGTSVVLRPSWACGRRSAQQLRQEMDPCCALSPCPLLQMERRLGNAPGRSWYDCFSQTRRDCFTICGQLEVI